MDRGAWWATVHGVTKSWKQLSDFHFTLSIFYKASLNSHELPQLLVIWESLNFSIGFKGQYLVADFFLSVLLNILSHTLLACKFSVRESAYNIKELYVMSHIFVLLSRFFVSVL